MGDKILCEFCGKEIKNVMCDCPDSLSAMSCLVNLMDRLKHVNTILKDIENNPEDYTEDQVETIIKMCEEEKKKLTIELDDFLKEIE